MLQGSDRLDRMQKWMVFLDSYFGRRVHYMSYVQDIPHDPIL